MAWPPGRCIFKKKIIFYYICANIFQYLLGTFCALCALNMLFFNMKKFGVKITTAHHRGEWNFTFYEVGINFYVKLHIYCTLFWALWWALLALLALIYFIFTRLKDVIVLK